MAHIRITQFAGIMPELSARLKPVTNAQIAHNCLLTDGSLRPQAQWVTVGYWEKGIGEVGSLVYDPKSDGVLIYKQKDAVQLNDEPFTRQIVVGADLLFLGEGGIVKDITWSYVGNMEYTYTAGINNSVWGEITYTRSYDSIKPVNRLYAATRVRKVNGKAEESTLRLVTHQSPTDILYEGDLVNISAMMESGWADGATHFRLYRSISGLDTGENVTNELDTEWHLVTEMKKSGSSTYQDYIDGESATALPLDVCFSQNFHEPIRGTEYFGLSEGGWFVGASIEGDVQISERYMHHAWPVDNLQKLQGETITDMAIHKDTVYIGTQKAPYVLSLAAGENGLQASAQPFPESIPCLPGTMAAAAGGALYASGQGVVALSREGQQVVSRDVANPGDILYRKPLRHKVLRDGFTVEEKDDILTVAIAYTTFGTYFQGNYYGFMLQPFPRYMGIG